MGLSDRQLLAVNMLVYEGKKKRDVCRELNIVPGTMTRWCDNPEFMAEYNKLLREKIDSISAEAIERICNLMYSPNHSVALNAAKDIASRAGLDAVVKQDIQFEGKVITIDYGPEEN